MFRTEGMLNLSNKPRHFHERLKVFRNVFMWDTILVYQKDGTSITTNTVKKQKEEIIKVRERYQTVYLLCTRNGFYVFTHLEKGSFPFIKNNSDRLGSSPFSRLCTFSLYFFTFIHIRKNGKIC